MAAADWVTTTEKQLGLGNIFGTRVWLLPENQKKFPCYVLMPQTDRGWARYDFAKLRKVCPKWSPGMGDGAGMALEIIDAYAMSLPVHRRTPHLRDRPIHGWRGDVEHHDKSSAVFRRRRAVLWKCLDRRWHWLDRHTPVGLSTETPTKQFLCPRHAIESQPEEKRAGIRSIPNTPESTTMSGNGLTPNQNW